MKAFYCVGTHWDREWYEPFQEFRMWLVELVDELLALMAKDPEYRCFHLDGQAVVLQDYLEIRPERRAALVELLKAGRLIAGPWYDLPDEWLISGESFIRNLMMGMRVCGELGVPAMRFAYTPDQFGHIAALPMIMQGFDMKAGICWRGTQDENYPAQFVWVGPDGSRMVTHKLRDCGSYGPFDAQVRGPAKKAGFTDASFKEHFEPYLEAETARATAPLVLMLDAIDHQRPDPEMPRLFKELTERYPDVEFVWDSLEAYADEMLKHAKDLPERAGELREPCKAADRLYQYLIVHTLSSRYPLKQRNDQCQAMLEKWAEPAALFQMLSGHAPLLSYLDKAWEYLLRNHPHDSICGCSIDQVHRDMGYRFDQAELIADGVVRRALASLGNASESHDALTNVVVHNPLPFERYGTFDLAVAFSKDWPQKFIDGLATAERVNKFVLVTNGPTAEGKRLPFQLSAIERGIEHKILRANGRRSTQVLDVYHLAVELSLPSCGYTAFRIEPTDEATRNFGSRMTGPMSASTGVVNFTLHPDGTGCLVHESSGGRFDGLFLYEDSGDSGDGWTRGQPINDIVYRTPGSRVTTAIEEDGPLRTVFRVERELDLPRRIDPATGWRSDQRTPLRVTDLIYVTHHAPCVRVRTRVENTCRDHRLRVLFPTHVAAVVSFAETPFAVVERAIEIPEATASWQERVNPEKAFTTFFGVKGQSGGLAVLAPFGLHEYAVTETPDRSLALTLFRATSKTAGTPGEPDGELLGEAVGPMTFEYLLYPFSGGFDVLEALHLVAEAQTGVRAHCAERSHRELPDDRSFLYLHHDKAVVTAIKPAANGVGGVIRLWNPDDMDVRESINLDRNVVSAALCNLNEEVREPITLNPDGSIPVTIPARGLATVRFTWE